MYSETLIVIASDQLGGFLLISLETLAVIRRKASATVIPFLGHQTVWTTEGDGHFWYFQGQAADGRQSPPLRSFLKTELSPLTGCIHGI